MKKALNIFTLIIVLAISSCSNDEPEIQLSSKSVTDCSFLSAGDLSADTCIGGPRIVSRNEIITFASKANQDYTDIQWIVELEGVEILDVENSVDNGIIKSIATLKFNSNFNGGDLGIKAIGDDVESISHYPVELEN